ncbi:MAG: M23 family metallopeptidase [Saprospiraceae bacterium]|nr:M23 family metallopeptidase [Saprospiraceae bacterium]
MYKIWFVPVLCLILLWPTGIFKSAGAPPPLPDAETIAAYYPKDYFQMPVEDEIMRVTGTFGELRDDHFHSGLDLKSRTGRVGQPVYAAADGYVDRIKVQAGGYGNVLYIRHPNGYSTVYAHLDKFAPAIEKYVRDAQYKNQRFEVNLNPPDGQFKFKQGEEIGKMGNTGGSTGPHLHFEVRHSATDRALNPLLFGLPDKDKAAPELRDMKVYFLNESREILTGKAFPIKRKPDGTYGPAAGDTVRLAAWRVGFGVKTYDAIGAFRNDNGVFALRVSADDQPVYEWRMEQLDFDETRYLNAHADYAARERFGAWFHRCFVLPGDRLSNYVRTDAMGAIAIYKEKPVKVNLKAVDAAGNAASITFWVLRADPVEQAPPAPYQYQLVHNVENHLDLADFSLTLPAGSRYENLAFQYETTPDESQGVYSNMHHLHDRNTPVHKYFDLSILPQKQVPPELKSKAVVARCGRGKPTNCGGNWNGAWLKTRVRNFGDYCIMTDTEPPTISPIVFGPDLRKKTSMSFRIRDNFSVGESADGLSFRGAVDGQWILFEYDRKSARITHTFDGRIGPGEHTLVLSVRDDRGNTGKFEGKFLK